MAERNAREDRQRQREHLALAPDLLAVLLAARAGLQVMAQVRAAQRPAAQRGELLADLRARRLARLAALDQSRAGLEDE